MNLREVRQELRQLGVAVAVINGEYRVRRIGSPPGESYFTNDLQDALNTGVHMGQQPQDGCQCEHIAHFDNERHTPNGNPGHRYGAPYLRLTQVVTSSGTFKVCSDCTDDCMVEVRRD